MRNEGTAIPNPAIPAAIPPANNLSVTGHGTFVGAKTEHLGANVLSGIAGDVTNLFAIDENANGVRVIWVVVDQE